MGTDIHEYFFTLLRLGIGTQAAADEGCRELLAMSMQKWREVTALAERQGVLAVLVDGLQVLMEAHKVEIKAAKESPAEWQMWLLENIGQLTMYEQRSEQQRKVIVELSEIWAAEGIKMMVFKGQANAALYPVPEHRATGDVDCWLYGEAERGDDIMKRRGAEVDFNWYRHSKISFQGETIENHRVMSHTRGNRKHQEMEDELRMLANANLNHHANGNANLNFIGKAVNPSAQFNACFLTYHGLHHFTSEGLRMKQILDWAMFLQKKQERVDWKAYGGFCRRYKLDRFAAVMNFMAEEYLNVILNDNFGYGRDDKWIKVMAEKVLQSTLYDDEYLFNSGKSNWMVRWILVKNMFTRDRWKYRDIAQMNVVKYLWYSAKGFLLERE